MEQVKVFSSNIIRENNKTKNNLYEIFNIIPVHPLPERKDNIIGSNDFVPKCDKIYVPKKKNSQKVKTVRGIRNDLEREVYSYLPNELEKQRIILMQKIRYGSFKDEKTKELAINMLKSDISLSKTAWQMLMNINPEGHKFASQYILWNGKSIQINGSKGGLHKFICNYDVGKCKQYSQKTVVSQKRKITKKRQLLHHSLNIKFKPGPLTKKYNLDISRQKYQNRDMELVTLPKPSLEVYASYGKPLAPVIESFVMKSFFPKDCLITEKWANFAVSVLGKNENGIARQDQVNEDSCVAFDPSYKCFQNRVLMRRDDDIININKHAKHTVNVAEDSIILYEVNSIMGNVLDAVEISFKQDEMYTGEDEPREIKTDNATNTNIHISNKNKRNGELRRLDVTIITISEPNGPIQKSNCQNDFCTLGCICDSLKCSYNLKRHCGRIECMFKCKCDFSKYKYMNSFNSDNCTDIIPGLINLDKTLSQTLAKEEHEFHQTVIVTDEKSILLKSNKRNWKAPKKYAEFYSNMLLQSAPNTTQLLSIVCPNLDCKNIQPWCMVHNLYKCFCKGKFTETVLIDLEEYKTTENENSLSKLNKAPSDTPNEVILPHKDMESIENMKITKDVYNTRLCRLRKDSGSNNHNKKCIVSMETTICSDLSSSCARLLPYDSRKFTDEYYKTTHKKILEMEQNDKKLQNRMISLISDDEDLSLKDLLSCNIVKQDSNNCNVKTRAKRLPMMKTELVAWLEKSYKQYKQRADLGIFILDPPKPGKIVLHSWEFVLSRYRERKNYFLICNQKPFRIFMAVEIKNAFFESCTNISDIALSDIDQYPITVKNLLTNTTDLKENFCIFRGLSHCWELLGSVAKINENRETFEEENQIDNLSPSEECSQSNTFYDSFNLEDFPVVIDDDGTCVSQKKSNEEISETNYESSEIPISKWFVMKIENDFREIQFVKKGFFVKYESVVNSINVARISRKTVRLSAQKCSSDQNNPQFGIYAIPKTDDHCVFIGPYENDENLGIETIKKVKIGETVMSQLRTRGIWITCKKVDNLKVIDNPLLFMPQNFNNEEMIILDNFAGKYNTTSNKKSSNVQDKAKPLGKTQVSALKQVKPIRIRKTNGFYHLTPNGCLKPIQSPEKDLGSKSLLINTRIGNISHSLLKTYTSPKLKTVVSHKKVCTKPIAEIAPQMKTFPDDVNTSTELKKRRVDGGMFVLKPEEINNRSIHKPIANEHIQTSQQSDHLHLEGNDEISTDIEKFLATSVICTSPPRDDVYIISDDENETSSCQNSVGETHKKVWIVCTNVECLGWIPGKKKTGNYLSFEFPGFAPSIYYTECEALQKINQLFARKVYVPKHIKLRWKVLESEADIKSIKRLDAKNLLPNFVLTKRGLRHKFDVKAPLKTLNDAKALLFTELTEGKISRTEELFKQKIKIFDDLEETSQTLEDESSFLLNRLSKGVQILE